VLPERELTFPNSLVRTEQAGAVEVNLPADVLFDFDKAELRTDARETLRELAALLLEKQRRSIAITGHSDAIGTDAYNQRLSERRAVAVKTWLVSREGIKSPPITTSGRGARDPVAPNKKPDGTDDPEGRQQNRRVTIVFRN
jgi:outer membrane protein OmpA-like peptidoglycan-associated protein